MTTPAITIRPAVPADAEGIATPFLESAAHHARLDPSRYFVPDRQAIVARYREGRQHPGGPADEAITLVAEAEGEIVGFVDARLDRPHDAMHRDVLYCYVAEIAVSAARRSQGIGEQLLREVEQWARRNGAELVFLEYNVGNTRAGRFYQERLGYCVASFTAMKRL